MPAWANSADASEPAPTGRGIAEEPGAAGAGGGKTAPQAPAVAGEPSAKSAKPTAPRSSFGTERFR